MKTKFTFRSSLTAKSLKLKASSGFTLIEMMIAFAIFAIIMVIAVGSLLSLIGANYKAQALKTVVNNLHFALENMSRNIRTGTQYHCSYADGEKPINETQNCATTPGRQLVFRARDGDYILYELSDDGAIVRSKSNDTSVLLSDVNLIPLTAPEIEVEALHFYVDGADNTEEQGNNKEQPRVLMVVKGWMQGKSKVISRFDIQTLVSQRALDIQ
ncbi:MAG: hypothetical protein UY50_C0026G0015 [Parcubacteria group bacterium GW2011_GWA2_49_9]|nr:MAG: hypothetical protein UY50_C0026G0015 [Parcubacteria group bacterium GW2011_GWA2_49_9]